MNIVTSTIKGQIVIPAPLRKKFNIKKGTRIRVYEDDRRIIVEPIHDDPVVTGRGMLKTKGEVLQALIADREEEACR
jgi:AbrB family looped-hinge helix DNA binding protein